MWVVTSLLDSVALYFCLFPEISDPNILVRVNLTHNSGAKVVSYGYEQGNIANYYWQLSYDLLSIVDRRVKNQKCLGPHNH